MKKIESFLNRISEANDPNEPSDPNATKPGRSPQVPQNAGVDVMAKAKEKIDAALTQFSEVLTEQAGHISEVFGVLNGAPTKIPEDWKAAILSTGLKIDGAYVPNVGVANPGLEPGKITFVKAGASARGTDTSYLGAPVLGSVPDTQTTATVAPGKDAPSPEMQASLNDKYDTSRYNEEQLLKGAELLEYAIKQSIIIVRKFAIGNLPPNVQPDTVISLLGPMFNNLLAYYFKNRSRLGRKVTPEMFVEFMLDANPQGYGTAGLGAKDSSSGMPLMFANAIAAYLPSKAQRDQVQTLRLFSPAVNFVGQSSQQDPKSQAMMVVPAPRGWPQMSRLYVSFPFLQSSFYQLFQKVLTLGAKTPQDKAAASYQKNEGVQAYVRRVYPLLIALGKEHGVARGSNGRWVDKATAQQQISRLKAAKTPTTPFGDEFAGNATTQPGPRMNEEEIPGFENAIHLALVTMDSFYKRLRKERINQIGFASFIDRVLTAGISSFLQESKNPKITIREMLKRPSEKKNRFE
jgi:hypothetical protein